MKADAAAASAAASAAAPQSAAAVRCGCHCSALLLSRAATPLSLLTAALLLLLLVYSRTQHMVSVVNKHSWPLHSISVREVKSTFHFLSPVGSSSLSSEAPVAAGTAPRPLAGRA
jgi:hypothetical protein